jgi:hypothetical protein
MSGKSGKDPKPPKGIPEGLAKFCANCGTQRTQGVAKFCENCGNSFDLSAAPNPEDDIAIRFPQESEALKQWAERYRPILTLGNAEESWGKVWTLLEKLNVDSGHVWVSCEDDGECLLLPIDSAPPEEKSVNRVSMYVTELPAAADDKEIRKTDVNVACGACDGEGGEECLSCRGGSEWIQISEVIDVPTDLRLLLSHFPSREEELRSLCSEGDIDAMFHLARLFELANCIEEALHFYDLAATGGDVDAMFNAGILLRKGGDNVGAEKYWRSAGELGDFKAFSNLGSMFEGQGKNAEAIEMYESAIALGCAVSPGRLEKLREEMAALNHREKFAVGVNLYSPIQQMSFDSSATAGWDDPEDFFENDYFSRPNQFGVALREDLTRVSLNNMAVSITLEDDQDPPSVAETSWACEVDRVTGSDSDSGGWVFDFRSVTGIDLEIEAQNPETASDLATEFVSKNLRLFEISVDDSILYSEIEVVRVSFVRSLESGDYLST